jgi:hypothetical protein
MRTAVTAGACVVLLAVGARADAPAPAPPDLDAEIAWARATWPGSFDSVHFHPPPLAKLRAWIARGPVPVYIFNDDFACRAAMLFPGEERRGNDAEPGPMAAKIPERSRVEDGRTVREVRYVTVDVELSSEDGSATEARGEDGRWSLTGSRGYGILTNYGALSSVDDRVARWDGERQVIRPYCGGPVEWLACAGGGERPCVRCEKVNVMIVSPRTRSGHSVSHGSRPVTCDDPCPQYPDSPSIKRLRALSARASLWTSQKQPLAAVPSLYRSREDCLREHPQVDENRRGSKRQ